MSQVLHQSHSACLVDRSCVFFKNGKLPPKQLTANEEAQVQRLLDKEYDFIPSEEFDKPDAHERFSPKPEGSANADVSWYRPALDHASAPASNGDLNPLLTTQEEQALFLQFNYCRFRAAAAREAVLKNRSHPAKSLELLKWHQRASRLCSDIVEANLPLVLAMAKRTRVKQVDFVDLVSDGNMALLRAVEKFDVGRGFKFSTYACRAILKAFSRSGQNMTKYRKRFPTDYDPQLEPSDYTQSRHVEQEQHCVDEVARIVDDNLAKLSKVEQSVIEYRFAVGSLGKQLPERQPLTLEQVGRIFGVTKERIRQIQKRAMGKIRDRLEIRLSA